MNWATEFLDAPFLAPKRENFRLGQLRSRCSAPKGSALSRRFSQMGTTRRANSRLQLHAALSQMSDFSASESKSRRRPGSNAQRPKHKPQSLERCRTLSGIPYFLLEMKDKATAEYGCSSLAIYFTENSALLSAARQRA